MHELPVTEQIVAIVLEHAREAKAERVLKINLVVGELSSFVGESIQFYFDMLSKGSEAENATLSVSRVAARARCQTCKKEFSPGGMNWVCPACGGPIEEILQGREFYIESIEVE